MVLEVLVFVIDDAFRSGRNVGWQRKSFFDFEVGIKKGRDIYKEVEI